MRSFEIDNSILIFFMEVGKENGLSYESSNGNYSISKDQMNIKREKMTISIKPLNINIPLESI